MRDDLAVGWARLFEGVRVVGVLQVRPQVRQLCRDLKVTVRLEEKREEMGFNIGFNIRFRFGTLTIVNQN